MHWRAEKRAERRMGMDDAVYIAYLEGESEASARRPRPNRYPPGRRHDAYERGLSVDLMGDHHGRNA